MSSFTSPLIVQAVRPSVTGWRRRLPPGLQRPAWEVIGGFRYAVGSLDAPSELIEVPEGFTFDGASVPLLLRFLFPMAHPDYIQAAALHDYMLDIGRWPRRHCDAVFGEALTVLDVAEPWRTALWIGVRLGSAHARLVELIEGNLK